MSAFTRRLKTIESPGIAVIWCDGDLIRKFSDANESGVNKLIYRKASIATSHSKFLSFLWHKTDSNPHIRLLERFLNGTLKFDTLLLTDSLSSFHALQDSYSTGPLIQRFLLSIPSLPSNHSSITFAWVPGHIGLPLHDIVDEAAKDAMSLPKITDPAFNPQPRTSKHTINRSFLLSGFKIEKI